MQQKWKECLGTMQIMRWEVSRTEKNLGHTTNGISTPVRLRKRDWGDEGESQRMRGSERQDGRAVEGLTL